MDTRLPLGFGVLGYLLIRSLKFGSISVVNKDGVKFGTGLTGGRPLPPTRDSKSRR